jgi:hypothetical protein
MERLHALKPFDVSYSVLDLLKAVSAVGKSPAAEATSTTLIMGVAAPIPAMVEGVNSMCTLLILYVLHRPASLSN